MHGQVNYFDLLQGDRGLQKGSVGAVKVSNSLKVSKYEVSCGAIVVV